MICVASALIAWQEEGLFIAVIPRSRLASSWLITGSMQHRASFQYRTPKCLVLCRPMQVLNIVALR